MLTKNILARNIVEIGKQLTSPAAVKRTRLLACFQNKKVKN
jgi:hypothetical protein